MSRLPLDKMIVKEKLDLIQELWADLCLHTEVDLSPAWHREVLAGREAALKRGEEVVLDWEEAKARMKRKFLESPEPGQRLS